MAPTGRPIRIDQDVASIIESVMAHLPYRVCTPNNAVRLLLDMPLRNRRGESVPFEFPDSLGIEFSCPLAR